MPADTPNAPLPHSVLASVLAMRGMFIVQWSGQIEAGGRSSPLIHNTIRRYLADIEAAMQAHERAELAAFIVETEDVTHVSSRQFAPNEIVRPPLSVVKP